MFHPVKETVARKHAFGGTKTCFQKHENMLSETDSFLHGMDLGASRNFRWHCILESEGLDPFLGRGPRDIPHLGD